MVDIKKTDKKIEGIFLSDGTYVAGDVFIEATGSTGPMGNCLKYGNGCSMCVLRCPSFGPRISLSERAGIDDLKGQREDGSFGAVSGSCKLVKESLSDEIAKELNEKGVVILKVPEEDINLDKLKAKVCQQYALKEFAENVILLDTGHAKLMTSYYPLNKLRKIPGLERVKFADPYAGGKGNSIRYLAVSPRTNDMKVTGLDNLFCAGEKSGLFVGHTEAMATGSLAGCNAVRYALNLPLITLPKETALGDLISFANEQLYDEKGVKTRYTLAGGECFNRMKRFGLYTTDSLKVKNRIEGLKLTGIFSQKLL